MSNNRVRRAEAPIQRFRGWRHGVNIVGYVFAESGVGEHTRLLVEAVREAGVPYSVRPFRETLTRQNHPFKDLGSAETFSVNVVGVNADEFPRLFENAPGILPRTAYTIGLWAWEVEHFPFEHARSQRFLDEIWANSTFSADAIRRTVAKPVFAFPLPIGEPRATPRTRSELGLPEGSLFLCSFDFDSVFDRKNPLAAINAFRQAFPVAGPPWLVVKTVNSERHPQEKTLLAEVVADASGVIWRDGYESREGHLALVVSCDCLVSLHRAEGFGLGLAEAMALGKPVVATRYSGNLDFMNEENSFLVPYEPKRIGPGRGPYPADARWAEPLVDTAAALLRWISENPQQARERGARARREVLERNGVAARGEWMRDRLADVFAMLDNGLVTARPPIGKTASDTQALLRIQALRERIRHGPDLQRDSKLGPVGPWLRRRLLRILQPYDIYVRESLDGVCAELEELQRRLEREP